MQPGSRKIRQAGKNRRFQQQRTRFISRPIRYSHINIQSAPDGSEDNEDEDNKSREYIRHDSMQAQIEERLIYANKIAQNSPPKTPAVPRTFAEATMSTGRGRSRSNSVQHDDPESSLSGPMSLESLGTFKYTFKKKKKASKWAPLDLSTVDAASEFGSNSEMGASSRAVSPSPATSTLPPPPFSLSRDPSTTTPSKTFSRQFESNSDVDTDPTPTRERFDLAAKNFKAEQEDCLDPSSSDISDTQSTQDRTEAAMSQIARAFGSEKIGVGNDAFDCLAWDPDLPAGGVALDQSPERVTATPKLITYTTVGSVVDPDAVPQFTAPNRIQREGAGRRPLMMQPRPHHEYFQPRVPLPSLGTQNSMQYTQQLAQSPPNFSFNHAATPNSSRVPRPVVGTQGLLSQQERQALAQIHIPNGPQMPSSNPFGSPNTPTPSAKFSNNFELPVPKFSINHVREEESGQTNNIRGPVHGLEKMQTLQRLAKFENPMQSHARSRLSEFSATKSQHAAPTPSNPTSALEMLLRNKIANSPAFGGGDENNSQKPGELNLRYQFPPPGTDVLAKPQTNPLFGAYGSSIQAPRESAPSHPPGYPQPLTAGPPGQRATGRQAAGYMEQSWSNDTRAQNGNSYTTTPSRPPSPWSQSFSTMTVPPSAPDSSTGGPYDPPPTGGTKTRDTLPMGAISKYYPYGFPGDMTGHCVPMSHHIQQAMGQEQDGSVPRNAQDEAAKRSKELSDWFYDGQRRWGMTSNEHINELTELQKHRAEHPFGAIGPPPKPGFKNTTCTMEQLDERTPTDLIAPLLHATFRSILANAENGAGTRKALSKIGPTDPFLIDDSPQGNNTVFGED